MYFTLPKKYSNIKDIKDYLLTSYGKNYGARLERENPLSIARTTVITNDIGHAGAGASSVCKSACRRCRYYCLSDGCD